MLELVEMPVCRAVEIRSDGSPQGVRVATPLGNEAGGVIEDQRRAVRGTRDDPRISAVGIGDDDRQRVGELPRFAAELQIAPAGISGELRNSYTFDDLTRRELRLEDPGNELGAFERALASRVTEGDLGVERRENRRPFGRRVR